MAATLRPISKGPANTLAMRVIEFTGDSSYPTGGYLIDPTFVGLKNIQWADTPAMSGHATQFDFANNKLLLYKNQATANSNPLVEVTAATNVTTVTGRFAIWGDPA